MGETGYNTIYAVLDMLVGELRRTPYVVTDTCSGKHRVWPPWLARAISGAVHHGLPARQGSLNYTVDLSDQPIAVEQRAIG
jgi:hypothetical protein